MPIKVRCAGCSKSFNAPDNALGKTAKCPQCGSPIKIKPAEEPAPQLDPVVEDEFEVEPPVVIQQATPPPPAPIPQAPTFQEPSPKQVAVDHQVSAKKGFFGAGFKGAMGCMMAIGAVFVIGCLGVSAVMITGLFGAAKVVDQTITAVEDSFERIETAKQQLTSPVVEKIVVVEPRLGDPGEFSMNKVVLEFSVHNQSDKPILSLRYKATIGEAGRSIPWGEDEIYQEIAGGIEPDETKEFRLSPNFMSDIPDESPPENAELKLVVIDADWPGKDEELQSMLGTE